MTHRYSDWVHAIWSTRGHWLPGDPRGFRDHHHRVHSSGDYHHPPPAGEHAGLYRRSREACPDAIVLPADLRMTIAELLADKFGSMRVPARILSVGAMHVHALIRAGAGNARVPIGRAKQYASHALRDRLPGRIWGQRCHLVRIRDRSHYRTLVLYIERHSGEGAAIWVHPEAQPPMISDVAMET